MNCSILEIALSIALIFFAIGSAIALVLLTKASMRYTDAKTLSKIKRQ